MYGYTFYPMKKYSTTENVYLLPHNLDGIFI